MFIYTKELAKRFVSDCKLPIPIITEEIFKYHLDLYEEDFGAASKYDSLCKLIEEKYNGDANLFLSEYYQVRDNIINAVLANEAFNKFNNMDMNAFAITDKLNITSNNIYKHDNIGQFFISIDLKKANFQILKKIDKDIVFGADTYENFVGLFTDSEYIKTSKYTREVIFGKMNPKRHITAMKYYTAMLYKAIIASHPSLDGKAVSLSNDEIIFKVPFLEYNDKLKCFALRKDIEKIAFEMSLNVRVEFFHLRGYDLVCSDNYGAFHNPSETNKPKVKSSFYVKDYFCTFITEQTFKLISAPLPFHSIMYKLYKHIPLCDLDNHFEYEGMDCIFNEIFAIDESLNS